MKSIFYQTFADGFKPYLCWDYSYLNIDTAYSMFKFESLRKDQSIAQSTDTSKVYSKPRPIINGLKLVIILNGQAFVFRTAIVTTMSSSKMNSFTICVVVNDNLSSIFHTCWYSTLSFQLTVRWTAIEIKHLSSEKIYFNILIALWMISGLKTFWFPSQMTSETWTALQLA